VVISDAPIDYPKAIQPDVLLALNQKSLEAFSSDLKPGGLLLVDADLVKEAPAGRVLALPFTRIARDLGRAMAANIVALGALAVLTGAVTCASLKTAVLTRVPPHTREMNEKALGAGMAEGRKLLAEQTAPAAEAPSGGEE
jgi:2-oxoglutarate ferredoxin oxidoreductase subunit gamma